MSHTHTTIVSPLARIGSSDTIVANNIRTVLEAASPEAYADGSAWYPSAHALSLDMATRHSITLEQVGGIIAALSPRTPWARNLEGAERACAGTLTGGFLSRSVNAANDILSGVPVMDVLGGRKTRAFARNVIGDTGPVTVDVWALRVALGDAPVSVLSRVGVYEAIADAYRAVGAERGLSGATVQAITWTAIRGSAH